MRKMSLAGRVWMELREHARTERKKRGKKNRVKKGTNDQNIFTFQMHRQKTTGNVGIFKTT
jgi:hypothetical protein